MSRVDITLPSFGESVQVATLAEICMPKGAFAKKGDVILLFQSEKATSEIYAPTAGVIDYDPALEVGKDYPIGFCLGSIDTEAKASIPSEPTPAPQAQAPVTPPLAPAAAAPAPATQPPAPTSAPDLKVSFEEWWQKEGKPQSVSEPSNEPKAAPSEEDFIRQKMSPLRRAIARRLVEARQKSAMLTTFNEVDMSAVMALREKHKEAFEKKHGSRLGFMSFFVKAAVYALKAIPRVNGWIDGDDIIEFKGCHISVAVSTDKGLMVPVIRHAEKLSFAEIEAEILRLSKKAKEGKLSMDDLSGGTFTITNGGTFGSLLSTPILNAPQSAILGMHAIQRRPVAVGGNVEIRPMMYLALSYDHRLIDGKEAVTFLVKMKSVLEDPSQLLLDL